MAWYRELVNGHILESGNNNHRLIWCPLCKRLIIKAKCEKLKQNCKGQLYPIKRYYYTSKVSLIKVITK